MFFSSALSEVDLDIKSSDILYHLFEFVNWL